MVPVVVQEVGQRMTLLDFVTDAEYADVLEGVKDLLIETYRITDDEALNILGQSRGKADDYLYDYAMHLDYIKEITHYLRETLDTHLEQAVDGEREPVRRMSNDAAVWLTFECIRRFCKKSLQNL